MDQDPFKEYLIQTEPNKKDKGYAWNTAIGLQAVDGLTPSKYLVDTAIRNIEGQISLDEAQKLLDTYYEENPRTDDNERTEEADKVSVRIAKLLSEKAFSFTPNEYISIHKKLFDGIYGHAGKIRDYNITKKEWVLDGETVLYGSASELRATLDYDFSQEKNYSYKGLTMDEIIHHLAIFVSGLWQIHIFEEGNTRTTAVFFIKYLRTLGFSATNDIFAENAWYFRNALVRAYYNNLTKGIHGSTEYLELFLRNLLCDEHHELHNRTLHVNKRYKDYQKPDIQTVKPDNQSAFHSSDYDRKIQQTIPYYHEFYEQVIELVEVFHHHAIRWLDIGCGTGKMGGIALQNAAIEKLVFCDSSKEMIKIAKERFSCSNTEFSVCDVRNLSYVNEFDVITAIQVNHYLQIEERKMALEKCYEALKENGLFISFENFAPFTETGTSVYLEKWKNYQIKQGKSREESRRHIERYGKEYFPITLPEHMELMRNCGFKVVEILWLSNMQVGFWGMK